jgi:uncharacterized protein (TIGR03435 family)
MLYRYSMHSFGIKLSVCILAASSALAQSAPNSTPLAFDVVSIRPSKPGTPERLGITTSPDGVRVSGVSTLVTIMVAYFPQGLAYWSKDRLSGAPAWLSDLYDINAKVSDADIAKWQKQGVALDKQPMFREMLQTMLADRCHLVAHMAPGPPISGWSLEVGKHAPRLTESKPGEALPAGAKLHDGGVMTPYQRGDKPHLTLYGATMTDLAQILSQISTGHPVQDHTGLTGHYDFVVNWISDPDSKMREGLISPDDPDPLSHWNIDALGLHVAPIKLPTDTLVIDHIEKPSEN